MSKLPVVNYKTMHSFLLKLGFKVVRQEGSHVRYAHPDGRTCSVPNHGSKDLLRPLIRSILRDINLTPDEYRDVLGNL